MTKKVAIIFGLGGQALDPAGGERYLATRLEAKGFTVGGPYNDADSQAVFDFLNDKDATFRAIVGDSLGADYAPLYAKELKPVVIDYIGGFQPSMYATDVRGGKVTVPDNVKEARCIRNPNFVATGGLGFAKYVAENPKKTKLEETDLFVAHPDDWGVAQDLVFEDILRLSSV
jgi:hypothetical protein